MFKYAIFSKNNDLSKEVSLNVKNVLDITNTFEYDEIYPDVVIVVGGDGTYLKAVRKYLTLIDKIFFVSINTGSLGFYSNFSVNEVDNLPLFIENAKNFVYNSLLEFTINDKEKNYCLNEVSIFSIPNLAKYKIYIDENFLEEFVGNGLVFSTQSGSTGLNKSLGGAIIDDKISSIQMTEFSGNRSNAYKSLQNSLVMDSSRVITINLSEDNINFNKLISFDTESINVNDLHKVVVKKSDLVVKSLVYNKKDYLERVKKSFLGE